jgi:hypothetical protein
LTVQAFSILCWYKLGEDRDNMAWLYNNIALAVPLHLGLYVIGVKRLAGGLSSKGTDQHEGIHTSWSFFPHESHRDINIR